MVAELRGRLHRPSTSVRSRTRRSTTSRAAASQPPITGTVTTAGRRRRRLRGDGAPTPASSSRTPTGDGDPATSDGIFVFTGSQNLASARATSSGSRAIARERFNQTTLNGTNSNSSAVPGGQHRRMRHRAASPPTDVTLPFANADFPERYEGMLVRLPQPLVICRVLQLRPVRRDRARPAARRRVPRLHRAPRSTPRAPQPTPGRSPTASAGSRSTTTRARRTRRSCAIPNGDPFSLANRFRGGDTVANTVGVLGFDFSLYRIYPDRGRRLHGGQPAAGRAGTRRRHASGSRR